MLHVPATNKHLTRSRLPIYLALFSSMFPLAAFAGDIQSEKWTLCYSVGPGCGTVKYWKLGDIGELWVDVSPKDYDADRGSIDLGLKFRNRTRCKIHIEGSFLRGNTAVATVEWGLITLEPGEEISGHRKVDGLRDMTAMQGLHLSLMAISGRCESR